MQRHRGRLARTTTSRPPFALSLGLLLGLFAVVGAVTAELQAGNTTYQWHGELVSLSDDPDGMALTATSRVVTASALAHVEGLNAGDPIVITWSGFGDRANGIRSIAADDGSGFSPRDSFRLRATFVEADLPGQQLTFKVTGSARHLASVHRLTSGLWATVTSPHRPSHGPTAVQAVEAYAPTGGQRQARMGPPDGATYQWSGELVSLVEAHGRPALWLKSRMASADALGGANLSAGDPILITWSGYNRSADSIRRVARDDGSGLWGSDRLLLRAAFVGVSGSYLTYVVQPSEESLDTLRSLRRGMWATGTSPHRPDAEMAEVVDVAAFTSTMARAGGAAPAAGDTYRWATELVSLDDSGRALSVRSRLVTSEARAAVDGLESGDAILITWSGSKSWADGIRSVSADDRSGFWGSDRLLLKATFVAADPARQYMTFTVPPPAAGVGTLRGLARGAWATLTSPHRPDAAMPVAGVESFVATPAQRAGVSPTADDQYQWHAELVALNQADRKLTVKARVVSQRGLAGAADLQEGDSIIIAWSGVEDRADGIRAVARNDGSGFWGSDRLLLTAEFEALTGQYLTFTVTPPQESLAMVQTLTQGSWATLSSPHLPSAGMPVTGVQAYAGQTMPRQAGPSPRAGELYSWNGELVSLSQGESTGTLTVTSRIVTPEGLSGAADLDSGDPILITWSGFENRASGIRAVARDNGSGLWGSDRFLLQAEFVKIEGQFLTFTVRPPSDSLAAVRTLTAGAWTTVMSRHRPSEDVDAVESVDAFDPARRAKRYVWGGELLSVDEASRTLEVSAPVEEHVFRYADRFTEGDEVMLIWAPRPGGYEVQGIRYLELRAESSLRHGYVLPATFVAADEENGRMRLQATVPQRTVERLSGLEPGSWIEVTSLFDQSGETAAVLGVRALTHEVN